MHNTALLAIILLCLFLPASVYPLSDKEYNDMYANSSEFRNSEKRLKEAWKDTYGNSNKKEKQFFLDYQRKWLQSDRDKEAKQLIEHGFSKDCAYARVNNRRISNLYLFARNFSLSPEEAMSAKTEDADYNFEDDEIIPDHCKK